METRIKPAVFLIILLAGVVLPGAVSASSTCDGSAYTIDQRPDNYTASTDPAESSAAGDHPFAPSSLGETGEEEDEKEKILEALFLPSDPVGRGDNSHRPRAEYAFHLILLAPPPWK